MAKTLQFSRNGAVGFIDWSGQLAFLGTPVANRGVNVVKCRFPQLNVVDGGNFSRPDIQVHNRFCAPLIFLFSHVPCGASSRAVVSRDKRHRLRQGAPTFAIAKSNRSRSVVCSRSHIHLIIRSSGLESLDLVPRDSIDSDAHARDKIC